MTRGMPQIFHTGWGIHLYQQLPYHVKIFSAELMQAADLWNSSSQPFYYQTVFVLTGIPMENRGKMTFLH